ncbi:hypothetical protein B0H14DRAFT_1164287 [Mycena olivaceomarginata]|nr:hypothetical protein B0H14DRAFT_1164287 [Mycena olivaceomarginata]
MPLDDAGMRRAGLAFVYRIVPVLVSHRSLRHPRIMATRFQKSLQPHHPLCVVHGIPSLKCPVGTRDRTTLGLVDLLLYPNDLSTDNKFARLYAMIARETSITGVLFECQVGETN